MVVQVDVVEGKGILPVVAHSRGTVPVNCKVGMHTASLLQVAVVEQQLAVAVVVAAVAAMVAAAVAVG